MKKILSSLVSAMCILILIATYFSAFAVSAPKTVSGLKYASTSTSVTLTWNKIKATGYRVYRYNSSAKKWVTLVTTSKTTATIKNLIPGSKATYAVKAYNKSKNKYVWAKKSAQLQVATRPVKVSEFKATCTDTTAKLTWTKAKGATGYRIYMYNTSSKKWDTILKSTKNTSVTIKKLKPSKSYTLAVKPYYNSGNGILWASTYTEANIRTATKAPNLTKVSTYKDSVKLYWSETSGQTGYMVYYSTKKDSGFKKYTNCKSNSAYVSGLTKGKTYYFKVRTYTKTDNGCVYSKYSNIKSLKITSTVSKADYSTVINQHKIAVKRNFFCGLEDHPSVPELEYVSYYAFEDGRYNYKYNEIFNLYYALYDINSDGTDELIIGGGENKDDITKYDIYTYKNKPVRLFVDYVFGCRANFDLSANGTIYVYGSNGASSSSYDFYKLPANSTKEKFLEGYILEFYSDNYYYDDYDYDYYQVDENYNCIDVVPEEYFESREKYYMSKMAKLDWIKISA